MGQPEKSTPEDVVKVLVYSDDSTTRRDVQLGVGPRIGAKGPTVRWTERATAAATRAAVDDERFDLLILDGEAAKVGGMGLARELKDEIFECPPILVLTGRPQDAWLASWSNADAVVPQPIDPIVIATTVAELLRPAAVRS